MLPRRVRRRAVPPLPHAESGNAHPLFVRLPRRVRRRAVRGRGVRRRGAHPAVRAQRLPRQRRAGRGRWRGGSWAAGRPAGPDPDPHHGSHAGRRGRAKPGHGRRRPRRAVFRRRARPRHDHAGCLRGVGAAAAHVQGLPLERWHRPRQRPPVRRRGGDSGRLRGGAVRADLRPRARVGGPGGRQRPPDQRRG
ncbi:unnamed protein product, partial [Prorocentrum cordatum]